MSEFRYYCLHDDGSIAVGEHVEAPDLDAAIHYAYEACRTHPTRSYRYVEVWHGAERLYFSPRDHDDGRMLGHCGDLTSRDGYECLNGFS